MLKLCFRSLSFGKIYFDGDGKVKPGQRQMLHQATFCWLLKIQGEDLIKSCQNPTKCKNINDEKRKMGGSLRNFELFEILATTINLQGVILCSLSSSILVHHHQPKVSVTYLPASQEWCCVHFRRGCVNAEEENDELHWVQIRSSVAFITPYFLVSTVLA